MDNSKVQADLSRRKIIILSVEIPPTEQLLKQTCPIYASLLANVNALTVQQARFAFARTFDQLMEALKTLR